MVFSTGQVAELVGVHLHRLDYLTRDRQIRPPKGPTGAFLWSAADIMAAAKRLGVDLPDEVSLRDTRRVGTASRS